MSNDLNEVLRCVRHIGKVEDSFGYYVSFHRYLVEGVCFVRVFNRWKIKDIWKVDKVLKYAVSYILNGEHVVELTDSFGVADERAREVSKSLYSNESIPSCGLVRGKWCVSFTRTK